jgi:hypothetical protein
MTNDEPTEKDFLASILAALTDLADAMQKLGSAHYAFREKPTDLEFVPSDFAEARARLIAEIWNPMLEEAIRRSPTETVTWAMRGLAASTEKSDKAS